MKIDIISASLSWENKQIIKEFKKRKIKTQFIDPRKISYFITNKNIKVFYKNKKYKIPNKVLCRGGFNKKFPNEGRMFLNFLTLNKVKIYDNPLAIYYDKDKLYQSFIFAKNKIPHPNTSYITSNKLIKKIKYPIVSKPLDASKGEGITKTNKIKKLQTNKLFQQLLSNSHTDIRILVLGNKVLGAMQRTAKKGEWRSNYALGASIKKTKVNKAQKQLALKASKALNRDFVGVDIITDKTGKNYVLEVNRAPQFKGFMKATKINISKKIVDYLISI